MNSILSDLKQYVRRKYTDSLPLDEMLDRMTARVKAKGIDEHDLILQSLTTLEQVETDQLTSALEIATRDRRKLTEYFNDAIDKAVAKRDALEIVRLQRLKKLIEEPPEQRTTRKMDNETVELAIEVLD